ncbi:MAG: histidinol-phosphate transaminase [Methylicorpusculum sp.]|uniref:histidinol-phosphate transaminase n=1 Tax=Methylicorpusculum sp. TaxID=2713644 RepID=UPI002716AC9C|nr:histidinol-phosphate transaminase [Methylicorpusculum sp.]MDO8940640.1 histidinol-phosphate transaminase [Methylicorpusculum sp.]
MNCDPIYELALPGVQQLIPYKAGKPIEELERELGLTNIIKLASNENPLGPSPLALAAIQGTLKDLALYPDGNGFNLKKALSSKFNIDSRQITLGNGSNELLELIARTFVSPEHEVVFSQHAFAVYPIVTQAVGAKAVIIPARQYGYDLDAIRLAISDKTRVVFIANPNNPTGTLLAGNELESFISDLPKTVICVLDEAYFEFIAPEHQANSLEWLDRYPNLIITRTFSKAYGLAGLRIGFGCSSALIADLLNRVRQPFNNNMLALAAAEAALNDHAHLQKTVLNNQQGMGQLLDGFRKLKLDWIPSAGNFVSVDLRQSGEAIYQALLLKGVIVRPVANYEMPHHLRISIGTQAENQIFLDALEAILAHV